MNKTRPNNNTCRSLFPFLAYTYGYFYKETIYSGNEQILRRYFADLPGPLQKKRLMPGLVFPSNQLIKNVSFYFHRITSNTSFRMEKCRETHFSILISANIGFILLINKFLKGGICLKGEFTETDRSKRSLQE